MRVLIIGAGLGGLTLLHGLRAAGIDARAFERSPRDGAQPASYGIHLNANGLAALHSCLPAENWSMIDAAGVPAPNVIRFRDPAGGLLATVDKRFPEHATDPVSKRRAISRAALRDALLHGTSGRAASEPLVNWGKRVTHYELTGAGVRAHFEDGTYAEADLLVGADGSNSRVRQQLLPHLQRQELGILNVAGRVPLSGEVAAALRPDMVDGGINNVVPIGSGWMFFSTWAAGDPNILDVSHGARQYVVWAWAAASASYPDNINRHDGTALKSVVAERISGWESALRTMVSATDASTVSTVPMRSMPQLPEWMPTAVTLLGDAIHNMTPMGGIGANTALRDADQLRLALTATPRCVAHAVGTYEAAMRAYANQALALSTRNARNAALASPLNRRAFRGLLRAGSIVAALQTKMFGPTVRT